MSPAPRIRRFVERSVVPFAIASMLASGSLAFAGTWTPLLHSPPGSPGLMLLLSDGTVMAAPAGASASWFRLTPDVHGSYVNGSWTLLAPSHDTRLYFASEVLRDGRVFVAGGEYGTGGPGAEVYDPLANAWTQVTPQLPLWDPSTNSFVDSNSEITPDGKVLVMPVSPHTSGTPLLYDPVSSTWSNAGHLVRGYDQDEASWVKLPDDSILTIDPFGTNSERYIPSTNTWVNDAVVPASLYDPYGGELGGAVLLPDGRAFYLGSTGHTALYSPSGSTSPGTWVAGPDIPAGQGTPDAPCAMMVNGRVLCAVSPAPTNADHFPSPTSFYEYDPVANAFTSIVGPGGNSTLDTPTFPTAMLDLPDGTVLFSSTYSGLYVYQPDGPPLPSGKPTITSVVSNGDGSYHVVGTGFNGISEGASYGDDKQMFSNYPLVRATDALTGNVFYGRTYDWSTARVQTGSTPVTTEFRLPSNLPAGQYSIVIVANGFSSDPYALAPSINAFCYGDGTDQFCPCYNSGAALHGCENSAATGGAQLGATGAASLSADNLQFTCSGELPSSLTIVLQGTSFVFPTNYGDGLRCVSGTLKRLYVKNASAGTVTVPQGADASISARSSSLGDPLSYGASRVYQVYYRDSNSSWCPSPVGGAFNASNAIAIAWGT